MSATPGKRAGLYVGQMPRTGADRHPRERIAIRNADLPPKAIDPPAPQKLFFRVIKNRNPVFLEGICRKPVKFAENIPSQGKPYRM
ncbi:MAG: hypothetical protein WBG50_25925, partial [Desulfomonilaceae bacterium]